MRYPKPNVNTIYLASPSMGCATSYYKPRLDKAIDNFNNLGFRVTKGPYIYNDGLLSSTPKNLADELVNSFGKYDLIMSVGGGEAMYSILEYIDFVLIKKQEPSWFMGYSDNTNFSFLLQTICDVASIYGGNAPEFGTDGFIDYQNDQIDLIMGKKYTFSGYPMFEVESLKSVDEPYLNLNLTEKSEVSTYPNGISKISGRIIGGCLDIIDSIVGTKFDNMEEFNHKYSDIIFAFEACDLTPIAVYRSLLHMKYAGWFKNTKAMVFGRPIHSYDMFGKTYQELIIDALKDLNIPIIFGLDFGHVKPQIPIIMGSICEIEIKNGSYKITNEMK